MLYLAILATGLFLSSSAWMVRDAYDVINYRRQAAGLSIIAFTISGEAMAILWWLVWSGR